MDRDHHTTPRERGVAILHGSIAHATVPAAPGAPGDHPGVIARPPRIAYLFLGAGGILEWLWPLPVLPTGWPALVRYGVGGSLLALGLALMTLAVRVFRQAGTNVETPKPATALVVD
jgi:hypothetical protein